MDGNPSDYQALTLEMPVENDDSSLDPTKSMVHSGSESSGWNESDSYGVVHGTSQVEHFAPQSLVVPVREIELLLHFDVLI